MSALLTSARTLSLAGAPSIWFLHFLAVYLLASFACGPEAAGASSSISLSLTGITMLTLAALALSGYAAAANYTKSRAPRPYGADESGVFLARTNALLHGLGMIAMVWVALPALVLSPCMA